MCSGRRPDDQHRAHVDNGGIEFGHSGHGQRLFWTADVASKDHYSIPSSCFNEKFFQRDDLPCPAL